MKYLLLLSLFLTGCDGCYETTIPSQVTEKEYQGNPIEVLTFDSCEYVLFYSGTASWGSHKGNCKNPIHK